MTAIDDETDAERLAVVLERLRTAPTDSLRWERRDLMRSGVAADASVRRMLAEHYRRIGAPDQAARWGVDTPGWARASELRALRRMLLDLLPDAEPRDLLGLSVHEPTPHGLADLLDLEPLPREGWVRGVAGMVLLVSVLFVGAGVLGVAGGVLIRVATGEPTGQVLAFLGAGCLAVLIAIALGSAAFATVDISTRRLGRARSAAVRSRVERLIDSLDRAERTVLLRSWLRSLPRESDAQRPARVRLVELARTRGFAAEAGRWGVAVDGLTTPDERRAFAATLSADEGWLHELERRTLRPPGLLGADERDVAVRAGVAPETIAADDERRRAFERTSRAP